MTRPGEPASALLAALWRNPTQALSPPQAAALEAAAETDLQAQKLLAMRHHRLGQSARAIYWLERLVSAEPTSQTVYNLCAALQRAGRPKAAIATAQAHRETLDPLAYHLALCNAYAELRDHAEAAKHGAAVVRCKDAAAPRADPPAGPLGRFDPDEPRRNIIAFSLYGAHPRYLEGARNNAAVIRYLYPGWTARFYIDETVPAACKRDLAREGAQLLRVGGMPAREFGLFWRFLVEDDREVAVYLVRDVDSVVNMRERAAVEDWLGSGKAFHIMRDWVGHCELMLAGMWGARRGAVPGMAERIFAHVKTRGGPARAPETDQDFLAREVWPLARQSALIHDSAFDLSGTVPFRTEFAITRGYSIGTNDWGFRMRMRREAFQKGRIGSHG